MLLVIAALWFWVFVPSWHQRSEQRDDERSYKRQIKSELKNLQRETVGRKGSVASVAHRSFRLSLTKRAFGALTLMFVATAGVTGYLAVEAPYYWAASASALLMGSLTMSVFVKAVKVNSALLASSAQGKAGFRSGLANSRILGESNEQESENDPRAWQRNPLPAPRQHIGQLEIPVLADVVSIEDSPASKAKQKFDSAELDEILRRRRSNG